MGGPKFGSSEASRERPPPTWSRSVISSTICAGVGRPVSGTRALGAAPRAAIRLLDVAISRRTTPAVRCHGNGGQAGHEEPWTSPARARVLFTEVQEASGGAMAWLR
jgi:hypothetical protein